MNSCIYEGIIHHRRLSPVEHRFRYRMFMMYLDLAELEDVFRGRLFWSIERLNLACFKRKDHLAGEEATLDETIRQRVEGETGCRPTGPIRLLTHLRYFGYCFNPVSFYYCWNSDDSGIDFILAEVNNTPWGERFAYVLDVRPQTRSHAGHFRFKFDKAFHVSPFMKMDQRYDWRFSSPGERLVVRMSNLERGVSEDDSLQNESDAKVFHASMMLERRPITGRNLTKVLLRYPFMSGRIIASIYWQALRLRLKRVPFVPHPKRHLNTSLEHRTS